MADSVDPEMSPVTRRQRSFWISVADERDAVRRLCVAPAERRDSRALAGEFHLTRQAGVGFAHKPNRVANRNEPTYDLSNLSISHPGDSMPADDRDDPFAAKRDAMRAEFFGKLFALGGFIGATDTYKRTM